MLDLALNMIKVQDFRSISGTVVVPVDAPVVLIHGPNGAGKSSLVSAIALALGGAEITGLAKPKYLVHHGAGSARIELGTSTGTHAVKITRDDHVVPEGLLPAKAAAFLAERCYLEQSALTRLLELYQEKPDGADSALTRFVKELLRLDELDALIGGLHSAGHLQRVRRDVPGFRRTEETLREQEQRATSLQQKAATLDSEIMRLRDQITTALAGLGGEPSDIDSAPADQDELQQQLEGGDEHRDLARLQSQLRHVNELAKRWSDHTVSEESRTTQDAFAAEKAAREQYQRWREAHGNALDALLTELRESFPRLPSIDSTPPSEAFMTAMSNLDAEIGRLDKVIAEDAATIGRLDAAEEGATRARTRLETLDEELADHGATTELERLAAALADLAPHIGDEHCPVCGRDFAEISDRPLAAHLAEEISRLSVQATRLQSLAKARLETTTDLERILGSIALLLSQRLPPERRADEEARRDHFLELRQRLRQHETGASQGGAIMHGLVDAQSVLARAQGRDRVNAELREEIEQIVIETSRKVDLTMPPDVLLAGLRTSLSTEGKLVEQRRDLRAVAADLRRAFISRVAEHSDLITEHARLMTEIDVWRQALATSQQRMMQARGLLHEVESTRRSIVASVFNSALNKIWADLFVRLAPDEPYVPAFCEPEDAGVVRAELETRRRDGSRGGSPRDMLSAGNLNTAALTLFLALHLSVAPRIPWLLLDDPVQSMDEVHVAQFAALLRTLVRQDRRLIIAVHERALFEYLALELSPAARASSLTTVELRRRRDGSSEVKTKLRQFDPDTALDAA